MEPSSEDLEVRAVYRKKNCRVLLCYLSCYNSVLYRYDLAEAAVLSNKIYPTDVPPHKVKLHFLI